MEDFRSISYGDGRMHQHQQQIESFNGQTCSYENGVHSMQDLRCYSASYASTGRQSQTQIPNAADAKFKKGKSTNGSASKGWNFNDPELRRKKRVASYKVYTVEGKVKGSLKKSLRWLKDRYSKTVYGWW